MGRAGLVQGQPGADLGPGMTALIKGGAKNSNTHDTKGVTS